MAGAAITGGLLLVGCGGDNTPANAPANKPAEPVKEGYQGPVETRSGLTYGALMCGGNQANPATGEERFVFTQVSIDQAIKDRGAEQRLITDIGFLVHGVIKHPRTEHLVAVFEKKGDGGAIIDLKANAITERIPPSPGHQFYGHGAYSADGKLLYATEFNEKSYAGRMVVRDAQDLKVVGEFKTHGEWPHDCQFIDDGKVVAITNGGLEMDTDGEPCVTYVEVATGKLLEKITYDNATINAGHLVISSNGDLAVGHAVRPPLDAREGLGGISLRPAGGESRTMVTPANATGAMKGETLSLCMHEGMKIVAATNPYGVHDGLITFWNYEKQSYVGLINHIKQPRGIVLSLNREYWIITFERENPAIILVHTKTGKTDEVPIVIGAACQGSHAYIHDYFA
jgi:hypothetical protein